MTAKRDDEEDEKKHAVAGHDGLEFTGEVFGEKGIENFATVEGMNGDEVEDGEGYVDGDERYGKEVEEGDLHEE